MNVALHTRLAALAVAAALAMLVVSAALRSDGARQTTRASNVGAEDVKIYEAFRAWFASQPADVRAARDAVVWQRYAAVLRAQGQSEEQADATIARLRQIGDRAEIERWNRILTAPTPSFNTAPNAFLVEMVKGRRPGRSLDVGMGQGRNTIYLAQQGWESVGFDPADRAVAAAQARAKALGVTITATVASDQEFDWGEARWDLIVLTYVGAREYVDKVTRSLRPAGMLVVEAFHRDATRGGPIGGAVVFDTNELTSLFAGLRVIRYEDTDSVGDFGLKPTRVVRLAAVKP
jgi:SAM-dependent methyltransferase